MSARYPGCTATSCRNTSQPPFKIVTLHRRIGPQDFIETIYGFQITQLTGKFEGKRIRGKQREKIMDGLATWLGTGKVLDTLAAVKDRDLWRDMIANAYKQGT
ncbi:hypothetical protein PoB_003829200 [Plakobranchus ocellatus]|uniref:Uncharacterized protein n=1 Tax=Plakobranchus ocellatus TaxID=259542 RepID=A0AAV4AXJ4_9GAST|nr:hypothetical protein PoB_003829200 [Plakobranchus ocellatus]